MTGIRKFPDGVGHPVRLLSAEEELFCLIIGNAHKTLAAHQLFSREKFA